MQSPADLIMGSIANDGSAEQRTEQLPVSLAASCSEHSQALRIAQNVDIVFENMTATVVTLVDNRRRRKMEEMLGRPEIKPNFNCGRSAAT